MSPPSQNPTAAVKSLHTRQMSGSSSPKPDPKPSKKLPAQPDVHYTLLVRLPFARGDFVEPPQVEWDTNKDQALWKVISRSSNTSDLDWEALADKFGVPHAFILQQAAWLYERHLSHVKAQMRKIGPSNAPTPPPGAGSSHTAAGGLPMKRLGSGGGTSRAPSALSFRSRDSPILKDSSIPGTPRSAAPQLSRTPSTTTVTQSRLNQNAPPSPRQPHAQLHRSFRTSYPPTQQRKPEPSARAPPTEQNVDDSHSPVAPSSPVLSSSSDSSSSSEELPVRRSQIFKRPSRYKSKHTPGLDMNEEQSDEVDDAGLLPFANSPKPTSSRMQTPDPSATLRGAAGSSDKAPSTSTARAYAAKAVSDPKGKGRHQSHARNPSHQQAQIPAVDSSASSASSATGMGIPQADGERGSALSQSQLSRASAASPSSQSSQGPSGISGHRHMLSPRHRSELARLSPRRAGKDGSDGTPSMGSSFSDLDDTSLTQSALEEALLSNMQHPGIASRMSNFSQALRSRYL
ncbi:hypothetical protein K402DRAFT_443123 [Aulographum hederae CBS 113979]|uniref:Autophagy-related protein 29 n=1 Tax=Aulographum hederae CBS 113979 TaxID=1176131 RepID=A0A6G1HH08_9PEZI|nr:hypothetical protein K402DRAFT_443123 [Aulographum hederae CBS 113979]